MNRVLRLSSLSVVGVFCVAAQQPPAFRSDVALLTAEAAVVDKSGRPVSDLQPADFTARVDGKPRKVLFAHFYGSRRVEAGSAPAPLPASAFVSSAAAAPGRIVVIVIDQDSIRPGEEKPVLETASKFVDSLVPVDAVGLLAFPSIAVNLTRDHARVREALRRVVGGMPKMVETGWTGNHHVTLDEADKITRGDRVTRRQVLDRECMSGDTYCGRDVISQAGSMVQMADAKIQATLMALAGLVDRLKAVRGPKHLVLISGGLPISLDALGLYQDFARRAAEAQVTVFAVHVDQFEMDASTTRHVPSPFGGREYTEGLANLASMTGGVFYSGVARATGVFARIATEINNFYELGLEGAPGDADGKPHQIDVKVIRPGLTVRSKREVIRPVPSAKSDADRLLELLYQPVDATDLPLAVATYATRGAQADVLNVLVSIDIGLGADVKRPVQWGFTVIDGDRVVTSHRQTIEGGAAPLVDTASTPLEPGRYTLHVAALDADGRGGVIQVLLAAGLRAVGPLTMSDLIVGSAADDRLRPLARVRRASGLMAAAELYAEDPHQLDNVRVSLQLIAEGAAQPAAIGPMQLKRSAALTTCAAQAKLDTASLAPGRYIASAIVQIAGFPPAKVSRAIQLEP